MATLIHITHEAREKVGGIGAVLEGLLTARAYQEAVERTILIGNAELPLARLPQTIEDVFYETGSARAAGSASLSEGLLEAFSRIETEYGARVFYGIRAVAGPLQARRALAELVLLDVRDARIEPVNKLKGRLWQAYGLESDRFQDDWGFEEWVRVALPALEAARALLGDRPDVGVLISHEFMGLPTLLAARLLVPDLKTIYWAHEVPPVRQLIETRKDQRLVFDEVIRTLGGRRSYGAILREVGGYKHALVARAARAHGVFAVSDRIAQELILLSDEFQRTPVEVVYNGLSSQPTDLEARQRSRRLLRCYVQALLGIYPDYVFTHVARPVASKSLDRDLALLEHLDDLLADRGQTGVLLILATDAGRRAPDLVRAMEAEYGWPVHHRVGWPDLVKGEVEIGGAAERYNEYARTTRVVLINQFGFDRESCGDRAPEDVSFQDLRQGSDVEFGQSAYEPFGIAQLETLAFGGICLMSQVCGSAQLVLRIAGANLPPNILIAHYAAAASAHGGGLGPGDSRRIEHEVAAQLARELAARLPRSPEDLARLLESGWNLARRMSWQAICREYFVPALERCLAQPLRRRAAACGSAAKTKKVADAPSGTDNERSTTGRRPGVAGLCPGGAGPKPRPKRRREP